MKRSDVIGWLKTEGSNFLSNTSLVSLSTPANHVDIVEGRHPPRYPFVGVQPLGSTSEEQGIGNGEYIVDSTTYTSGTIDSITIRRDSSFQVELMPVTDGDPKLRDDLMDGLYDHFGVLQQKEGTPNDMTLVSISDSTPQHRTNDYVWYDGIGLEIEYESYTTITDIQAAEKVNVDVESGDNLTDTVVAYSETFT